MAYSHNRLIADGQNDIFSFSFPYLSEQDLVVLVDGVKTPFEQINRGVVRLTTVPQTGLPPKDAIIEIRRNTSVTALAQEYKSPGLSQAAIKANADQTLWKLQELDESLGEQRDSTKTMVETIVSTWLAEGFAKMVSHQKVTEDSAMLCEKSLQDLQTLKIGIEAFASSTETSALKLMGDMGEKATLLDTIITEEAVLKD